MEFNNDPNSTCAALVANTKSESIVQSGEPPSFALRRALGSMLKDSSLRTFIPPIVHRLHRCASKDIDVLTVFFKTLSANIEPKTQDSAYQSMLLYNLITFSEMWETPAPSKLKLKKRFTGARISDWGIYATNPLYCAFSKEKSTTCNKLNLGNYDASAIIYERDEYWNKSATIPTGASVLLLSSKLDPQTPHKYAKYLLDTLVGKNKELITFDYATHGTVMSTQLVDGDPYSETCGMELLASYVRNGGDLTSLDKSYVDKMPAFNLTIPTDNLYSYLSTENAYSGVYNESLSAQYYAYSE